MSNVQEKVHVHKKRKKDNHTVFVNNIWIISSLLYNLLSDTSFLIKCISRQFHGTALFAYCQALKVPFSVSVCLPFSNFLLSRALGNMYSSIEVNQPTGTHWEDLCSG